VTIDLDDTTLRPVPPPRRANTPGPPARFRVVVVVGALALFAALVALLYLESIHGVPGNSDGATVVLEGQSMSTGNLLLHHWALSYDSFWSVDAIFYTIAVLVTGVRPVLLHLVPAVIAAMAMTTGALMARTGRRGVAAAAGMATVFALLALPGNVLASFLLAGPLHVGTVLWCLLAFVGLRRGRLGWGWALAVVLLAAGTLGDFQTVALGVVPAFLAGVVAMVRARDWRRGVTTAAAPVVALVVAGPVRLITVAVGAYRIAGANPRAPLSRVPVNLRLIGTWGAHMLGLGGGVLGAGGVPRPLQAVHVFGALVLGAGVVVAAVGLVKGVVRGRRAPVDPSEQWRVDDLLVLAFVADLVVFVAFTTNGDQSFSRYLTGAVIFGAVLAGRLVTRLVVVAWPSWVRRGCAVLGVAVVAAFGAGVGFNVTAAAPPRPVEHLGRFLEAHHLDNGIGDYWSSSATTVATRQVVKVRPVDADDPSGHLERYQRQSADAWYTGQSFQFLVFDTSLPWGNVDAASAKATFGPVLHTYDVGTYRVLVWNHPLAIAAH
jgi:hypothetical protein